MADFGFEDSTIAYYQKGFINKVTYQELLDNKQSHNILFEEFRVLQRIQDQLREVFIPGSTLGTLPVNFQRILYKS